MKFNIYQIAILGVFLMFTNSCKKEDSNIFQIPVLKTSEAINVTQHTAKSGGEITNNGGTSISERGVCWSTSTNPSISDSKTSDDAESEIFISSISSLTSNTIYYVRAFATNSIGTGYGNEIIFTTLEIDSFAIGAAYQGGIIGYLFQEGDSGYVADEKHGIIVALQDFNNTTSWGCSGVEILGADSKIVGAGSQNTTNIVNACSSLNCAAKLCFDLVVDGYDDWFLPSKDELDKLCQNRLKMGNFESNFYWSSSDDGDSKNAWTQSFGSGSQYFESKSYYYYVRAVRKF